MGFLDRLFGRGKKREPDRELDDMQRIPSRSVSQQRGTPTDEQALDRYRYLLRTAPPEAIEQAHEEAFAQLTPEQRQMALRELSKEAPPHERFDRDDPKSLARMATRAELRQPGTVERIFMPMPMGGYGGGMMGGGMMGGGMMGGGLFGGGFMSSLAGGFIGSMVAQGLYDSFNDIPSFSESGMGADGGDLGATDVGLQEPLDAQGGDYGADAGGDYGADVGGDYGGDIGGDFGGDFGGSDL